MTTTKKNTTWPKNPTSFLLIGSRANSPLQYALNPVGFFLSAICPITKHYELAKATAKDDATPEELKRAFDLLPERALTQTKTPQEEVA